MRNIIYMAILLCLPVISLQAQEQSSEKAQTDSTQIEASVPAEKSAFDQNVTKALADSAYAKQDYISAIGLYEQLLAQQGESADIYYNLGNSYYKHKDIAHAVLNYERAHLLNPGDSDIRFNLEMARNNTIDKVDAVNTFFLTSWFTSLRNCLGTDGWARVGVITFILALICLGIYIFGKNLVWRKVGFIGTAVCIIIIIAANVCAFQQKDLLVNRQSAIIMSPSVTAKSTPDTGGTDLFILHEGHKVLIKDSTMKEWCEIQLEDGSIGWIPREVMEII